MTEVFIGQGSIFSIRRCLVAGVVFFGACQSSSPANGQAPAKPLPSLTPPSQPSPSDPSIDAPTTVEFDYSRAFGENRGTTPIASISAGSGASIGITAPAFGLDPRVKADIKLATTFFGKSVTYTFRNVPQDKPGHFTVFLDTSKTKNPNVASLQIQVNTFCINLTTTLNTKLPVNNDPKIAIVWGDPVTVQVIPIAYDPAIQDYASVPVTGDSRSLGQPQKTSNTLNFLLQE